MLFFGKYTFNIHFWILNVHFFVLNIHLRISNVHLFFIQQSSHIKISIVEFTFLIPKMGSSNRNCPLINTELSAFFYFPRGFIVGNRITSLMLTASVISITILSIPIPSPPVGGIPYSRAVRQSSSIMLASSSPAARLLS